VQRAGIRQQGGNQIRLRRYCFELVSASYRILLSGRLANQNLRDPRLRVSSEQLVVGGLQTRHRDGADPLQKLVT